MCVSTMLPFDAHISLIMLNRKGITAIFNLTEPGEHPHCGDGLEASSGFPYLPETFMREGSKRIVVVEKMSRLDSSTVHHFLHSFARGILRRLYLRPFLKPLPLCQSWNRHPRFQL